MSKSIFFGVALLLVGCGSSHHAPLVNKNKKGFIDLPKHFKRDKKVAHKKYKVGKTYKIKGVAYTPFENFDHKEVGMASWYGPGFHGRKTAIGTRFNMHALTCAHRTLQMPCKVKVTNLSNGKSVNLTVNDRGPFAHNRVLDISREGARRLGFLKKGHTKVKIEVLREPSLKIAGISQCAPAPLPSRALMSPKPIDGPKKKVVKASSILLAEKHPEFQLSDMSAASKSFKVAAVKPLNKKRSKPSRHYIQAGAFKNYKHASVLSKKLSKYAPSYVASACIKGENKFRVHLGPFTSSARAKKIMAQLTAQACSDLKILQVG